MFVLRAKQKGRLSSSMCPRPSAEGGLFCTLLPGPTLVLFSPELYGKLVYFSSLLMKRIITERKKAGRSSSPDLCYTIEI